MLNKNWVILICFISNLSLYSQTCDFLSQRYQVKIDSNVVYGSDSTFDQKVVALKMNIYEPIGDSNNQRPVIIWIYGGAFVAGTKEDMGQWCMRFAKRGYLAVAIQYRLGFFNDLVVPYIGNIPRPYGSEEPMRAAYRAQQDLKGAIRYIKGSAGKYGLDTSMVFIGGQSAGAITALSAAFVNENGQKPTVCGAISNYNNNIQGINIPRPDLGPVEGRLNLNGTGTKVKGVVNMFGAIFDTSWIKTANDVAVFSYHQSVDYSKEDIVVSSYTKTFFWSLNLNYPWAHGSRIIQQRLTNLGYDSCHAYTFIYPGFGHSLHDEALVDAGIAQLMGRLVCNTPCYPLGISDVVTQSSVLIAPNPAEDELRITAVTDISELNIYSIEGKLQSHHQVSLGPNQIYGINISSLPSGMYILQSKNNQRENTIRFVKE